MENRNMESFTYSQETDGEKKNDNKGSRRETGTERGEGESVRVYVFVCPCVRMLVSVSQANQYQTTHITRTNFAQWP